VLGIPIRDPGSRAFLNSWIRDEKKNPDQGSRSQINILHHISESLVTIFGGEKYSNSLSSGEAPDSGSGMEKSRSGIRDGKIRDPG
jgi:hypothetical protein